MRAKRLLWLWFMAGVLVLLGVWAPPYVWAIPMVRTAPDLWRYDLVVVGVPWENLGSIVNAGVVHPMHGGASGVDRNYVSILNQNVSGVVDTPAEDEFFGYAVTGGDFNGDNYPDIAVGVPGEQVGIQPRAGSVHVFYYTPSVRAYNRNNKLISQSNWFPRFVSERDDFFGRVLASGDFNGDGFDDLAVGVPAEDVNGSPSSGVTNAGAVQIIYGSASGLGLAWGQQWHQDSANIPGAAEPEDRFGSALAVGDFNGDGYDDLAIGVPKEDIGGTFGVVRDAGGVLVIFGSKTGLAGKTNQWFDLRTLGESVDSDELGRALTACDFNGDGYDDLVMAAPFGTIGSATEAGAVYVLFGGKQGLKTKNKQKWHQGLSNVTGIAESSDYFGAALTCADFNGDGYADLAVGAPGEDVGSASNAGAVNVLYGARTGLTGNNNQLWYQGLNGIAGVVEPNDYFGYRLAAGDINGDGFGDLVVGVPYEDLGGGENAGVIHIIFGGVGGLRAQGNELWYQDRFSGLGNGSNPNDRFGFSLAVVSSPRGTSGKHHYMPALWNLRRTR